MKFKFRACMAACLLMRFLVACVVLIDHAFPCCLCSIEELWSPEDVAVFTGTKAYNGRTTLAAAGDIVYEYDLNQYPNTSGVGRHVGVIDKPFSEEVTVQWTDEPEKGAVSGGVRPTRPLNACPPQLGGGLEGGQRRRPEKFSDFSRSMITVFPVLFRWFRCCFKCLKRRP